MMKRYNATQIRLIWNGIIFGVLAIGIYVVWIFPGIELQATGMEPNRRHARVAGIEGNGQRRHTLSPGRMSAFIGSMEASRTDTDPFLRSGEEEWKIFLGEVKARPPRLQGIITVQETRTALIDGARYRAGDRVQGFTVTTVTDTDVVLVKDDRYYTIHLAD